MEMIIVLGIFSVAVVIVIDIFLSASMMQRKTSFMTASQGDARLVLETIAREFRDGTIDYNYYKEDIANKTNILAIRDINNRQIIFQKSSLGCPSGVSQCVAMSSDGGATLTSLTSDKVEVLELDFYLSPSQDPFKLDLASGQYPVSIQPRLTIDLVVQSKSPKTVEQTKLSLQTTVSSRMYKR